MRLGSARVSRAGLASRQNDPFVCAAIVAGSLAKKKFAIARGVGYPSMRTRLRDQPTERVIQICERSSIDRIVVTGAAQFDDAFFSGACLDDKPVKPRRDDLIFLREQKNGRRSTRARVRNAVKISRDLQCHWTGQQPQIPPAELAQNHLAATAADSARSVRRSSAGRDTIREARSSREARAKTTMGAVNRLHVSIRQIRNRRRPGAPVAPARAGAKSGIIHPPDLDRAILPHPDLMAGHRSARSALP